MPLTKREVSRLRAVVRRLLRAKAAHVHYLFATGQQLPTSNGAAVLSEHARAKRIYTYTLQELQETPHE